MGLRPEGLGFRGLGLRLEGLGGLLLMVFRV